MNRAIQFIIIFLLPGLFIGCNTKSLDKTEYVKWVQDKENGLHKIKTIEKITFDVQYKPYDFILLKELRGNSDSIQFNLRKRDLEGLEYFDLKLSLENQDLLKHGVTSPQEYQERLYYFSFDFQNDIQLFQGDTSYSCKLFHFERSYNLTTDKSFVLGFDKPVKGYQEDMVLRIDSRMLGVGTINIKFNKEDLQRIPELKL